MFLFLVGGGCMPDTNILFFDGVCNLCNRSVQIILRRDKSRLFLFAPLQGASAEKYLSAISSEQLLRGMILVTPGGVFQGYSAVLKIASILYPLSRPFVFFISYFPLNIPGRLIYELIAQTRYRFFGRRESCPLPTPEWNSRFLP